MFGRYIEKTSTWTKPDAEAAENLFKSFSQAEALGSKKIAVDLGLALAFYYRRQLEEKLREKIAEQMAEELPRSYQITYDLNEQGNRVEVRTELPRTKADEQTIRNRARLDADIYNKLTPDVFFKQILPYLVYAQYYFKKLAPATRPSNEVSLEVYLDDPLLQAFFSAFSVAVYCLPDRYDDRSPYDHCGKYKEMIINCKPNIVLQHYINLSPTHDWLLEDFHPYAQLLEINHTCTELDFTIAAGAGETVIHALPSLLKGNRHLTDNKLTVHSFDVDTYAALADTLAKLLKNNKTITCLWIHLYNNSEGSAFTQINTAFRHLITMIGDNQTLESVHLAVSGYVDLDRETASAFSEALKKNYTLKNCYLSTVRDPTIILEGLELNTTLQHLQVCKWDGDFQKRTIHVRNAQLTPQTTQIEASLQKANDFLETLDAYESDRESLLATEDWAEDEAENSLNDEGYGHQYEALMTILDDMRQTKRAIDAEQKYPTNSSVYLALAERIDFFNLYGMATRLITGWMKQWDGKALPAGAAWENEEATVNSMTEALKKIDESNPLYKRAQMCLIDLAYAYKIVSDEKKRELRELQEMYLADINARNGKRHKLK